MVSIHKIYILVKKKLLKLNTIEIVTKVHFDEWFVMVRPHGQIGNPGARENWKNRHTGLSISVHEDKNASKTLLPRCSNTGGV